MDIIGIGIGYLYYIVKDKSMLIAYPTQLLTEYIFDTPWIKGLYQTFQN